MRSLAIALIVIVLAASRAPAADPIIDAGALRAVVTTDPWRVTFTDAAGAVVLRDAAGGIGFRTPDGTVRAQDATVLSATPRELIAAVDTDDPGGRALAVRLRRDADGVIAYEVRVEPAELGSDEALMATFEAAPDERFFGFGERANAVEHRGAVVESYVSDGPYHPTDREVVSAFVPPVGFRFRDDATYFPIPWLLSSRGYGVLVDNDDVVYHHLAVDDADRWSVEVTGAPEGEPARPAPVELALRVFAGPTPADALRRFTARVGRQPRARAAWVFGPWFQPGGPLAQQVAQIETLREADAPVSVAQTYLHYLPCGDNRSGEPDRTTALHAVGVAVTTYFNPMLCTTYQPAFDRAAMTGALFLDAAGEPYIYPYTGSRIFNVGQFDFTAPAGRLRYRELLALAIADGHDGWMEDFGEYTPLDAFTHSGRTGAAAHNRYPVDYHCGAYALTRRAPRPIVRFQRSGWTGAARCATVVWNGDPTTDWGFDGLASVVTTGLSMGLSGVSTWGSDIGGFFGLFGKQLTGEMLARWVQLGAVSGVMRTQRNGFGIPAYTRPQVEDPDQIANWRRWAKFRTQLYPYIRAAESAYRCRGLPIMRHLVLHWPDDPQAVAQHDAFLFGPDLLVAPVLEPGVTARPVYLPAGDWVELWQAVTYDPTDGGLELGSATPLQGPATVTARALADELPLFVRAGAILPLLPPDVDTLADYGAGTPGLVRLADRLDQLEILAFPRGTTVARALPGDRLISRERPTGWELKLRSRQPRTWHLQATLATLTDPFVPCAVALDDHLLPTDQWSYDETTQVLRTTVQTRRGTLRVRKQCIETVTSEPVSR